MISELAFLNSPDNPVHKMTHQHTEAKIISPKNRETLTEPHYMFCETPAEEHRWRGRSGLMWL